MRRVNRLGCLAGYIHDSLIGDKSRLVLSSIWRGRVIADDNLNPLSAPNGGPSTASCWPISAGLTHLHVTIGGGVGASNAVGLYHIASIVDHVTCSLTRLGERKLRLRTNTIESIISNVGCERLT